MFVQFGVVLLEPRNSRIPWKCSTIDPCYECSQSRIVVESPQLFSNLNQLLDLPRSVFRFVVTQNQGDDPDAAFNSVDDIIMIVDVPICQMFGHLIETCDRIRLGIFLPRNQYMLQPVSWLDIDGS